MNTLMGPLLYFKEGYDMPDLQRHSLNFYLNSDVEDIVVFLALKMFTTSFIVSSARNPKVNFKEDHV